MYREATALIAEVLSTSEGITPMYREATKIGHKINGRAEGITPMYREATLKKRLYRAFLFLNF